MREHCLGLLGKKESKIAGQEMFGSSQAAHAVCFCMLLCKENPVVECHTNAVCSTNTPSSLHAAPSKRGILLPQNRLPLQDKGIPGGLGQMDPEQQGVSSALCLSTFTEAIMGPGTFLNCVPGH